MKIFAVLMLTLTLTALSVDAVKWSKKNCKKGVVADAACCQDRSCKKYGKDDCQVDPERNHCRLIETKVGGKNVTKCVLNRDVNQKVCCKKRVNSLCTSILDGYCPERFVIDEKCAEPRATLWTNVLKLSKKALRRAQNEKKRLVCANDPCHQLDIHNCSSPGWCLSRSGFYGDHQVHYGFNPDYLPNGASFGQILQATGLEQKYYHLPSKEHGIGKEKVDEITVDDLMTSLVEALSNDNDFFEYSSSTQSDTWFGKTKHVFADPGVNAVNPDYFIKSIYGNPYGLSRGQYGFADGVGWPTRQQYLPHGYSSSSDYGYSGGYSGGYNSYYGGGGYSRPYYPFSGHGGGYPSSYNSYH